jgi:cytochrome P450
VSARPRIDLTDPASFAEGQPHDAFRWLRENDPVHWHAEPDGGPGFFAATRYEDVRSVGRDPGNFSSVPTILIPDPQPGMNFEIDGHQMMLMMDPPKHTQYRRLISSEFTPRGALKLVPRVRELAAMIIDRVIERGECDLVEDIAGELPSYVIADLLGIPLEDGRKLYRLTETIHSAPESLPPGAQALAVMEMFQYAAGVIAEKRAHPADDLATKLCAEVDGRRFDDIDFNLFLCCSSTRGRHHAQPGRGRNARAVRPGERRKLARPRPAPAERVEEMLRGLSVIYMRRMAADVELGGRRSARGRRSSCTTAPRSRRSISRARPSDAAPPNLHLAFGGDSTSAGRAHRAGRDRGHAARDRAPARHRAGRPAGGCPRRSSRAEAPAGAVQAGKKAPRTGPSG